MTTRKARAKAKAKATTTANATANANAGVLPLRDAQGQDDGRKENDGSG
jgi:hypothetical protein